MSAFAELSRPRFWLAELLAVVEERMLWWEGSCCAVGEKPHLVVLTLPPHLRASHGHHYRGPKPESSPSSRGLVLAGGDSMRHYFDSRESWHGFVGFLTMAETWAP